MADENDDKRYDPTSHKLNEARKKGDVARSSDIAAFITLTAGFSTLLFAWNPFISDMKELYSFLMLEPNPMDAIRTSMLFSLKWLCFLTIPVAIAGILSEVMQGSVTFTTEPLTPKFDKMNPATNIKQIFSMESFFTAVKALLTFGVVVSGAVILARRIVNNGIPAYPDLMFYVRQALPALLPVFVWLLLMSISDIVFTRLRFKHKQRMSVQEMKEENKQTEGDPMIKHRRRSLRAALMRRRMTDDVKDATVVIVNPVHLAVALKYNLTEAPAPVVVAKGARKMAQKIKQIARDNRVPIIENPPVAQLLFKFVPVGAAIPPKYYKIVAEILAYVMTQKAKNNAA
jgi:flagellar biosynthetic protein FlhB